LVQSGVKSEPKSRCDAEVVAVLGSLRQKAKPVLSEEIRYGVENQMMSVGYLLDIVLDHRRSTDDLGVDRHAPAVTCGGRPGGEMSG
jgi:hypothetical protein